MSRLQSNLIHEATAGQHRDVDRVATGTSVPRPAASSNTSMGSSSKTSSTTTPRPTDTTPRLGTVLLVALSHLQSASRRLKEQYGAENLVEGRGKGRIPREGRFGQDGKFSFRGVGCRIDDGSTAVEFDFGPGGRTDGFDAWRLHVFAWDNPDTEDVNLDTSKRGLEAALESLCSAGEVSRLDNNDSLYYLGREP